MERHDLAGGAEPKLGVRSRRRWVSARRSGHSTRSHFDLDMMTQFFVFSARAQKLSGKVPDGSAVNPGLEKAGHT
jgi:hypothetical protein